MRLVVVAVLSALLLDAASARCLHRVVRAPTGTTAEAAFQVDDDGVTFPPMRDDDEALERRLNALCNGMMAANWALSTDLASPEAQAAVEAARLALDEFVNEQWEDDAPRRNQSAVEDESDRNETDSDVSRQLGGLVTRMETLFSTARVCPYGRQACDLRAEGISLNPGLEAAYTHSRDYDELAYLWTAWHDASGRRLRADFKEYVRLSNLAAKASGADDTGQLWQSSFDIDDLEATVDALWAEVEPLYRELHAYALRKLRGAYPGRIDIDTDLIPAHVLGDLWGVSWINLYDILVPFPNASFVNVTKALKEQNFTPLKMFEMADDFYQSMGLFPSAMAYGEKAMIEKPEGREVDCHPSAWDFCDGKDFRIKMCAQVNQDDFFTIHHELGHIQYYQQYAHLPSNLRDGANRGFDEAIGDTIILSVSTPKHLEAVGLLKGYVDSRESRLNALMKTALMTVAFVPLGLLVDKWRWDVFAGDVAESQWNGHWWRLKAQYQGVTPPVPRSEADLDAAAINHVATDSQYISYFVAHILQFQFYRALCIEAGQYDPDDPHGAPLHTCDFYNSTEAGQKLAAGLRMGKAVHWRDTLETITGSREMSGSALLEYFQPLYRHLREANGHRDDEDAADGDPVDEDPATEYPAVGEDAVTEYSVEGEDATASTRPSSGGALCGPRWAALAVALVLAVAVA